MKFTNKKRVLTYLTLLFLLVMLPRGYAAHYIVGQVNDSLDGTLSNGKTVIIWNPVNGISDNITDIIGPQGSSESDNLYFLDCDLLNIPCSVGDQIRVKVLNNGDNYITSETSTIVSGSGFDLMPYLRLNSIPTTSLFNPVNNSNFSSSSINLTCNSNDLDGNLANVTLYGSWNGWHANQTKTITGYSNQSNFTKILQEGSYFWNCLSKDNLSTSKFATNNFSFNVDLTPPNITSLVSNLTGQFCETNNIARITCNVSDNFTGINSVKIQSINNLSRVNYTAQLISQNSYYADILINHTGIWDFSCISEDYAGNSANKSSSFNLNILENSADLQILNENIIFQKNNPVENEQISINATIFNMGCSIANNFTVSFFENDPDINGILLNNKNITINPLSNITINISLISKIGQTNIFVYSDFGNNILELNESNNKANKTLSVSSWHEFFGNITVDKIISNSYVNNLTIWANASIFSGNVFVVDNENSVNWFSLQAIGKNYSGSNSVNDFSEIDYLLNMTNFSDSIYNLYTNNTGNSLQTNNFTVFKHIINNVPVINSINNSNFMTGILWDKTDDSNGEFNINDKEDLVFVAKINRSSQGAYGIYDYETRIPAKLREYNPLDSNKVLFYYDLN